MVDQEMLTTNYQYIFCMHFWGLFVKNHLLLLVKFLSEVITALCLFIFNFFLFLHCFRIVLIRDVFYFIEVNSSSLLSPILNLPNKKSEPYLKY